ncbi:MAG TPA: CpaF family protein [Anaerolineales bacterium]|nr:CpaF family protein [Anaerolineales bacterium]
MSLLANLDPPVVAADVNLLKSFLMDTLSRGLENEQTPSEQRGDFVRKHLQSVYELSKMQVPADLRHQVFESVINEMAGYGPIQPLLDNPEVTEIMVNGPNNVYVERAGLLELSDVHFEDEPHLLRIIDRIILPLGRHVDAESPTVDARLPDGSRVNAVVRPVAIDGPTLTIRRFPKERLTAEKLVEFKTLTPNMATFLKACVIAKLNIVISGGTGSGKTTLLNVLSGFIPETERIVTIEDAAELQLQQAHVVRMETKPPNMDGLGATTVRDLVRNCLRMRPDRIVVGECRGGETLDMLQAMNSGHDGSLTTLHANTPRDALSRLETMVLMAGTELPIKIVRQYVSSAIDLIVQQSRLRDGSRKITSITEVAGMEGETIVLTDIFKFEPTPSADPTKAPGEFRATGMRPQFTPRLEAAGIKLSAELFGTTLADRISSRERR